MIRGKTLHHIHVHIRVHADVLDVDVDVLKCETGKTRKKNHRTPHKRFVLTHRLPNQPYYFKLDVWLMFWILFVLLR